MMRKIHFGEGPTDVLDPNAYPSGQDWGDEPLPSPPSPPAPPAPQPSGGGSKPQPSVPASWWDRQTNGTKYAIVAGGILTAIGAVYYYYSDPPMLKNPKGRTYAQARAELFDYMRADGWSVSDQLKVPHAHKGDIHVWFKTQAVYIALGTNQFKYARSAWVDIRAASPEAIVRHIEKIAPSY